MAASERRTAATSSTAADSVASCRWSATAWTTSADTAAPSVIVVPSRVALTSHSAPAVRRVITTFGAVRGGGVRGGRRLALVEDGPAGGGGAGGAGAADTGAGVLPFASAAFGPREVDARSSGAKGRVSRVPLRVTLTLMYSGPSVSGSPTLTTVPVPPAWRRTRGVAPRSRWARSSVTSVSVRAGDAARAGGITPPYLLSEGEASAGTARASPRPLPAADSRNQR